MKPELLPEKYLELLTESFRNASDPLRAEKQMAYMRHQFEFMGLAASTWYPMTKKIFAEHGLYSGNDLKKFAALCYDQPFRELQYVAIEMMQRMLPGQGASWINVLEKYILTDSWWDTVDWLAKLVGVHFKNYPDLQYSYCYQWIDSSNIWLQRAAIIHQLFYREKTDEKLLFDLITKRAESKEFFIRKASGWALRQYSKTNPESVKKFVKSTHLSPLTRKEALRLM